MRAEAFSVANSCDQSAEQRTEYRPRRDFLWTTEYSVFLAVRNPTRLLFVSTFIERHSSMSVTRSQLQSHYNPVPLSLASHLTPSSPSLVCSCPVASLLHCPLSSHLAPLEIGPLYFYNIFA
jgi:hypothetical protein